MRTITLLVMMLATPAAAMMRPYDLDVGRTLTVRGDLYCAPFSVLCELRDPTIAATLDVSLSDLPGNLRGHIIALCESRLCRGVTLTGRVVRGINEPYLLIQQVMGQ